MQLKALRDEQKNKNNTRCSLYECREVFTN